MSQTAGPKGLGDLRTALTARLRSRPRREGMEYLDLYMASLEKKRLAHLALTWERQGKRASEAHQAVSRAMAKLEAELGVRRPAQAEPHPIVEGSQASTPDYAQRQWRRMSLDY